jgi:hypothetical protein
MNTPTQPRSYRLKPEDREIDFSIQHGTGKPLGNRRRLPGWAELGFEKPGMDEITLPVTWKAWEMVKAAAVNHGCPKVGDVLSPAEGRALAAALRDAVEVERDGSLKNVIRDVLKALQEDKGLRVV